MKIKGIKYIGPLFDGSGYGQAARGNVMALHKLGVPITLAPVSFERVRPNHGRFGPALESLVNKEIDYNFVVIHTTPEFWRQHVEPDKINVGYTIWETSKLHSSWPVYINNSVSKVLVGCEWNVGVFRDSGVTIPIGVVPHIIDVEEFENIKPYNIVGIDEKTYVFYDIFQFTERKHPPALLKAYWHTFTQEDNVALVLKTYRNSYEEKEKDVVRTIITNLKKICVMDYYPKVYFISHMLTRDEILGLHSRCNCFVSLDRGEGFGLSGFTAGAFGNPIIVTGWGGATEYAKPDNSYLVNHTLTPVSGMRWIPWYRGDQLWAEPDLKHASDIMREVYENPIDAEAKGMHLRRYIRENFSWEVVGKRFIKELEDA